MKINLTFLCVYICIDINMKTMYFQIRPLYTEQKRSQKYYYQTIPEIHRTCKKSTDIFII